MDELAEQARELGIDLDGWEPAAAPDFDVWPENHQTVMLFASCATQWRAGPGGVLGLDYRVVFDVMDLYAVEDRLDALLDVQVMEAKAMEILNKGASK